MRILRCGLDKVLVVEDPQISLLPFMHCYVPNNEQLDNSEAFSCLYWLTRFAACHLLALIEILKYKRVIDYTSSLRGETLESGLLLCCESVDGGLEFQ